MKYALLSVESDAKTVKGTAKGYLTGVLYLAPANEASDKHNMCPKASAECKQACLYGAGMAGVFPSIKKARIEKTMMLINDPKAFEAYLVADVHKLITDARKRGLKPAVRINGTSDLPKLARTVAGLFPDVQFYDYTKIDRPWERTTANYHLTFSHSGDNLSACLQALDHGINVAVVFAGKELPASWHGLPVINGDESDLRFLDPKFSIVGLLAKGDARKMQATENGFIQLGVSKK